MSATKRVSHRLTKYSSSPTDDTSHSSSSHCHVTPFHRTSQHLFVVVVAVHYWKVVAVVGSCCIIVVVMVVNVFLAHGGRSQMEAAAETMVVVERKEECVCLVTGVQQTNNVCQTTRFRCIPFLHILRNIPVPIPECPNSARMIRHRNDENGRPSCQSSFLRNPPDSAGMTGFLRELGGHCKDLHSLPPLSAHIKLVKYFLYLATYIVVNTISIFKYESCMEF